MSVPAINEAGETCILATRSAKETEAAGASLAKTLYDGPVTIALTGELGAGKTTFLRGFFTALGTTAPPISPTYALEQRHPTKRGEALHLDLYRLSAREARDILASTDDHPGIRAIEWFDRANWHEKAEIADAPRINLSFAEAADRHARTIRCTFRDAPLPTDQWIDAMRKEMHLPTHVAQHCDAVAHFAMVLAEALIAKGQFVRMTLLHRAARLHDLFRFVDFRPHAGPQGYEETADDIRTWKEWGQKYPGLRHEMACAAFLREEGFAALATAIETHGLQVPKHSPGRVTIEQQLLYYADKRVNQTDIVSIQERFEDFIVRYGKGKESSEARLWHDEAIRMERELFPEGAP